MDDNKLPEFLREYFWDVEFEEIDPVSDGFFVTNRIMDRGNTTALKWVLNQYGAKTVREVLHKSRNLDSKTAKFWAKFLGVKYLDVPCLRKAYSPIHFGLYS